MSDWSNLDKIFIANCSGMTTNNYGYITKEWIKNNNPAMIERSISKPVSFLDQGHSLVWEKIIRYYRDGRMEQFYTYTSTPSSCDNVPILSPIGFKSLQFFKDKTKGMVDNDPGNYFNNTN